MKLYITSIGKFTVYKSTNTDEEPCYLVDSDTGTMYFNCRWYDLPAIRKLLKKLK